MGMPHAAEDIRHSRYFEIKFSSDLPPTVLGRERFLNI